MRRRAAIFSAGTLGPLLVTLIHRRAARPGASELSVGRAFEQRVNTVSERSASDNLDGGAPDGIAIAIDVKRAVGGADDDRDRPARAALRLPVVIIIRERAQHFRRKILRRKHQSGIRRKMRHGRFAIPYHNSAALRGLTEKQLREVVRQANTTVTGWITGQITRVHGNAG